MNREKRQALKRLLLDVSRASEGEQATDEQGMDDERLSLAISGEQPLTGEEERRLYLSSELQRHFLALARAARVRREDAFAEARLNPDVQLPLAAADGERAVDPFICKVQLGAELGSADLKLFPIDAEGRVWRFELHLDDAQREPVLRTCPLGIAVHDEPTGETLVECPYDADSRTFVGFWERAEDLLERLDKSRLGIRPV